MKGEVFLWLLSDNKTAWFGRHEVAAADAMVIATLALVIGAWLLWDMLGHPKPHAKLRELQT